MVTPDRLRSKACQRPRRFSCSIPALAASRCCVRSSAARPDAHYVYVADDAFFPYGHHSEDAIIARVVPLIGELIAAHAPDLVVIACNTASTLVMSHLRERLQSTLCRNGARHQAGLRAFEDQARIGARHQGHRQARIHPGADPRFRAGLRGDTGGLGGSRLAGRSGLERRRGQRSRRSWPNSRPVLSATATTLRRAPTPWCWPAPIIRC